MKKFKYLHILWHEDTKFNKPLVEMINIETEFFSAREHCFITPYMSVYEALKGFSNVQYVKNGNLINKYGKEAEWIFVHSLNGCGLLRFLFTKRKYARKVIFRTWGGNQLRPYYQYDFSHPLSNIKKIIKNFYIFLYHKIIKSFFMIGVANIVDEIDVAETISKSMRTYSIPYSYIKDYNVLFDEPCCQRDNSIIRILVGNSANSRNNHLEIINLLSKFKDERIEVHFILSYGGEKDYIDQVKHLANLAFGDKAIFVEDFLDIVDFQKYISKIHIGIIADKSSRALGLFNLLACYKSKIYVEKNGRIDQALQVKNCIPYRIEDINSYNFTEFVSVDNDNLTQIQNVFGQKASNKDLCLHFKKLLDELDELMISRQVISN